MWEKTSEYLKSIADAFVIAILVVLPLYMKDKLIMIGDAKYYFFINISLTFFIASVLFLFLFLAGRRRRGQEIGWSSTDICVLAFGAVSIFSWLFSEYKDVGLFGYSDWHMGLVTQLLLVWSYFFVSRCSSGGETLWKLAGAASGVVFLIGVLNRYQYDPLGAFTGIGRWDWNANNLLSTIGNINWYSGYVCTALPVSVYFYWKEHKLLRAAGGIGTVLGLATLITQGSQSGFAGLGGILLVLLFCSLRRRSMLIRFLQVALLAPLTGLFIRWSIRWAPRGLNLPEEKGSGAFIAWNGWWWVLVLLVLLLAILIRREQVGKKDFLEGGRIRKLCLLAVLILSAGGLLIVWLCSVSGTFWQALGGRSIFRIDAEWGSGRGALWRVAWKSFLEGSWKQRLLGAGPDCYACLIYSIFDMYQEMHVTGQFQGAVFANAHNEWLNMLVTQGILGAAAYIGIFITAFKRYTDRIDMVPVLAVGLLTMGGYIIHNIFSFQQIITTPVMLVTLAMCENQYRRLLCKKEKK